MLDDGPIEPTRAVKLMTQILAGLAHAHELGIVHRDVKPANIMLTERIGLGEQVRILDFGLARLREQNSVLTMGMVIGTPSYMAPEQLHRRRDRRPHRPLRVRHPALRDARRRQAVHR